jgi:hypothetical protein
VPGAGRRRFAQVGLCISSLRVGQGRRAPGAGYVEPPPRHAVLQSKPWAVSQVRWPNSDGRLDFRSLSVCQAPPGADRVASVADGRESIAGRGPPVEPAPFPGGSTCPWRVTHRPAALGPRSQMSAVGNILITRKQSFFRRSCGRIQTLLSRHHSLGAAGTWFICRCFEPSTGSHRKSRAISMGF